MVDSPYTNIGPSKGNEMFADATKTSGFQAFDSLALFVARIGAVVSGAQEASRVYNRLSQLSDGALAARGLGREDVTRLTLQALDGTGSR
jgi:hypothetical protein